MTPIAFAGSAPLTWRLPTPLESTPVASIAVRVPSMSVGQPAPVYTLPRPPVCNVYPSSAHDVQALLTEIGTGLTEDGADVWIIVPAT